ncbi:hypothetical protein GCM10023232_24120 [Sphingosinicella ginsenosidimutans]|nr:thioredoxin domain-containing protein [Sphingosinicella ginsenosidimutans]
MRLAGLVLALAALVAMPAAEAQRGRSQGIRSDGPGRRDWTQTAMRTPEGFRIGDPDARVKLVEYLSPACADCVRFAADSDDALFRGYVRRGQVSVEYRNVTLNAFDLAATFLARCARPAGYFDMTHYLLAHQADWMGRANGLSEAQRNELRALPMFQAVQRLVPMIGLDRIAQRFGLDRNAQQACLADQAAFDRLTALQQAAQQQNVGAPPAFFVNGERQTGTRWAEIEPSIRAALGD